MPSPSAFVYVLDPANALLVFEADDVTGQLRSVEAQQVIQAFRLAADPRGRFVFVAGGLGGRIARFVRSYAVDAASGRLDRRSHTSTFTSCHTTSLAANERQVYALGASCSTGYHGGWVVLSLDPRTGVLAPAPSPPSRFEPDFVVADPKGRFVYTGALERQVCSYCPRLFVSALRTDGWLEDVGGIMVARSIDAVPVSGALGHGVLFVADAWGRITSFGIDEESGLPTVLARGALEDSMTHLTVAPRTVPDSPPRPGGRLAASTHFDVRIYDFDASGELSLRDVVAVPWSSVPLNLAFHPSGRFLYSSGSGQGVLIFSVAEDGRLQQVGREERGGGSIVVIAPPS
jgi:6-phosphogluconolactonase (cycloisomerase 2 family)